MTPRPHFVQAPTCSQLESAFKLIRFGRKIVAKGLTFTPEEAVEFRALMNRHAAEMQLPFGNDNDTPEQLTVRAVISDIGEKV